MEELEVLEVAVSSVEADSLVVVDCVGLPIPIGPPLCIPPGPIFEKPKEEFELDDCDCVVEALEELVTASKLASKRITAMTRIGLFQSAL